MTAAQYGRVSSKSGLMQYAQSRWKNTPFTGKAAVACYSARARRDDLPRIRCPKANRYFFCVGWVCSGYVEQSGGRPVVGSKVALKWL